MQEIRAALCAAAVGLAGTIVPALAIAQDSYGYGLEEAMAAPLTESYAGEIRAGLYYNSDVGPDLNLSYQGQDVFGTAADLQLALEANSYDLGFVGSLTIADAFGTGLTQEIVANTYSSRARPELGRDVMYWGSDVSSMFSTELGNGLNLRGGLGYQILHIDPDSTLPAAISDYVAANGETSDGVYVIGQAVLDRAEMSLMPGAGYRVTGGAELGHIGATDYLKLTLSGDIYRRLGAETTIRAHARIGRGFAANGADFPVFKNLTGGGIGSIRGFATGGIGPVSPIAGSSDVAHVGGTTAFVSGIELAHPVTDDQSLYLIGFVDAGTVTNSSNPFADLRHSAGLGLRWESPLGPFDVSFAKPFDAAATDITESIQFSFGMRF